MKISNRADKYNFEKASNRLNGIIKKTTGNFSHSYYTLTALLHNIYSISFYLKNTQSIYSIFAILLNHF